MNDSGPVFKTFASFMQRIAECGHTDWGYWRDELGVIATDQQQGLDIFESSFLEMSGNILEMSELAFQHIHRAGLFGQVKLLSSK